MKKAVGLRISADFENAAVEESKKLSEEIEMLDEQGHI